MFVESTKSRVISSSHSCLDTSNGVSVGLRLRLIFLVHCITHQYRQYASEFRPNLYFKTVITLLVRHQNSHCETTRKVTMVRCYQEDSSEVQFCHCNIIFYITFLVFRFRRRALKIILRISVTFNSTFNSGPERLFIRWFIFKQLT